MFNLVLAVISITLFALILAGGLSYINSDFGLRRATTERLDGSIKAFDSAYAAYVSSNGGARPTSAGWKQQVSGYLVRSGSDDPFVMGVMTPPRGMAWHYDVGSDSRPFLCLSPVEGETVPPAVVQGLSAYVARSSAGRLESACPGGTGSDVPSAVFVLQSAS